MTPKRGPRPTAWMLVFAALAWPAFGQLGNGLGSESTAAPHTVRGTVVNSVSGEPIYRALVQLGAQYATLTDHDGHFDFEGVTAAGIPPFAMKPGYFAERRLQPLTAQFPPSGEAEPVVVKLVPEAILSGTVLAQDGAPLEGIPVQLKTLSIENGLALWRQRQSTTTNSEGRYRFAELEAGKYAVTTGFHSENLADAQGALAYVPARFPSQSGGSSGSALAISLNPGDRGVADLSPEVEKIFSVTGTISGYAESRGVSFRVETPSGEEISPMARFTARTGEFRLMLPSGSFQVTATAYARQGPLEAQRQVTVPQAPVKGVSFAMEPYATIPVDVQFETVNQPSASTPWAPPQVGISLASVDGVGFTPIIPAQPIRRQNPGDTAQTGPGPMTLANISPGRYVLQAQVQPPWYVASAFCGGTDLTRDELAIAAGAAGCSIRVVLRNDSGSVHVTIRQAEQNTSSTTQPALYVSALPLGNLAQHSIPLNPQNSEYSADGVAPGRYLVLALDQREELPYRDPEAMRRYAALGQEITVTPNGKADAEIGPGQP